MSEERVSLPETLFKTTLNAVVEALGLTEQTGEEGQAYLPLISQLPMVQGEVGDVRLFTGGPLFRLVTVSMVVEPMQLDSHMMFAFMPGDSAVPHFTLDSVMAGDHFAFHLDLLPRVDLGSNLPYMDEVFGPLTEIFEEGSAIEGLSKAHLSPRQYAIMSPWMLANRATPEAFQAITDTVAKYRDHWLGLVDKGVSTEAMAGIDAAQLAARNVANKKIIFDPDVDPVWNRIAPMIGEEAVAIQRALLIGEDE